MSKWRLFLISVLVTTVGWLVYYYVEHSKDVPSLVRVDGNVFITSQLAPRAIRSLETSGFNIIVDIRPDGEAPDQTPSAILKSAAEAYGMRFHYIPVPHESIPATAVEALSEVLPDSSPATVLYCRTGRRAVRLYALVLASRLGGPNAETILQMVRNAGFSADDLKAEIGERVAKRNSTNTASQ